MVRHTTFEGDVGLAHQSTLDPPPMISPATTPQVVIRFIGVLGGLEIIGDSRVNGLLRGPVVQLDPSRGRCRRQGYPSCETL